MKSMKEIEREWLIWLIRKELLLRYPDAHDDLPNKWRAIARETAAFYERGEEVPEAHWKKACVSVRAEGTAINYAAANVAAFAANLAVFSVHDVGNWGDVNIYSRMAIALIRIADIEPIPELDANILAAIERGSTLEMDAYHTCKTTHCRGGFAIMLHPQGRALEEVFGSRLVAAAIYLVSTGKIPDFFSSNEDAMASIRKGAGL